LMPSAFWGNPNYFMKTLHFSTTNGLIWYLPSCVTLANQQERIDSSFNLIGPCVGVQDYTAVTRHALSMNECMIAQVFHQLQHQRRTGPLGSAPIADTPTPSLPPPSSTASLRSHSSHTHSIASVNVTQQQGSGGYACIREIARQNAIELVYQNNMSEAVDVLQAASVVRCCDVMYCIDTNAMNCSEKLT
jgi:hypothetical protein